MHWLLVNRINCQIFHFLHKQGVTYDTGGADVKAGGVMAGMHR